jgi:hypothetical protein
MISWTPLGQSEPSPPHLLDVSKGVQKMAASTVLSATSRAGTLKNVQACCRRVCGTGWCARGRKKSMSAKHCTWWAGRRAARSAHTVGRKGRGDEKHSSARGGAHSLPAMV